MDAIFRNQGQICSAGSRLLVQESIAEKFFAKIRRRMSTIRISTSLDKSIDMSAVLAGTARIQRLVDTARAEGADVWQPDIEIPETGDFWVPTLITNVGPTSTVVQNEIFGPVVAAMTFRDAKDAVELANNQRYGLGSGVWSENISLALDVAHQIRAGMVWVNCYNMFDATGPFGGRKETGYGRQGGQEGLMNYVKPKWMPFDKHDWTERLSDFAAALEKWSTRQFGIIDENDVPFGNPALVVDKTPKLYIAGKQVAASSNYVYQCRTPTGEVIGQIAESTSGDVAKAIDAAHKAAPGWAKTAPHMRGQLLFDMAENLSYRVEEFAKRIHIMTGRTMESCTAEVEKAIERLFTYASWADKWGGRVQEVPVYGLTVTVNDPIGVIGIVCPEEYPLLGFVSSFAPAVARGNAVVVVPSEAHPLSATDMFQTFDTTSVPAGVINVVTGGQAQASRVIAAHEDLTMIWHFGDAESAFFVEYLAHDNCKRTWCAHGIQRDWMDNEQGEGLEFLHESVEYKTIWMPAGI
ncbi:Aldehyde dehydrogenase family [Carpediemonas membranifera]|uniref:Aldehyde dehydrogenase family n=1 Tax=Carpediemonas membranifera TaxID=201153 RepID=A0A8J6E2E2_9EUKA|nr:Aldehyde dehydrogenase family [Carpediemonas membranifera]|eukprot:KAG9394583.1 Aldehyde dehydrogenase family [Carpediemonas membranifera]